MRRKINGIKNTAISKFALTLTFLLFNNLYLFAQNVERVGHYGNGKIRYKETVNADNQVVKLTTYYKSGVVSSIIPIGNEKINGLAQEFNRKGRLVSETEYLDGECNGIKKVFYKRSTHIITCNSGTEEKTFQVINYFRNGKVKSKHYNRFFEGYGPYESFYENGNPKIQGDYVGTKRNGVWKFYSEDGTLKKSKEYNN